MAKGQNILTDREVRNKKEPGLYRDGDCLYLQITKAGVKSWTLRYMLDGKARWMGLGPFTTVSLAEAREAATIARKSLQDRKDPIELRRAAVLAERMAAGKMMTFRSCGETFIKMKSGEWSNAKHEAQWTNTLETYAYPLLGAIPVGLIEQDIIVKCLSAIWTEKTETATRLRQRIEAILDWATASKLRSGENPARWKGHLDKLLAKPNRIKKVEHHPALPFREMHAFMAELRALDTPPARAMELAILTACRTSEVIGAKWSELDFKAAVWSIPAERMKAKKEHRIPLSVQALALLKKLPRSEDQDFVFPGRSGVKPLSNMAMLKTLESMKRDTITVHGFRSTFRDWAAETTNTPPEVVEMALAHTIKNAVEAAYRRGDLLEKRSNLMQSWADHCDRLPSAATITPIGKKSKTAA